MNEARLARAHHSQAIPHQGRPKTIGLLCGFIVSVALPGCVLLGGCISDETGPPGRVGSYQRLLAEQGPQDRLEPADANGPGALGLLEPRSETPAGIEVAVDPNTGRKTGRLTIEQAIAGALANSSAIKVVSYDPAISRAKITRAASEFDPTAFGEVNYEEEDNPVNSSFLAGQSEQRMAEAGIKQKGTTGAEWSLSYALSRKWDDLAGRTLPTRYEPIVEFQLRQPLLRDAWSQVNLAGVDVARLNHKIALLGFRQRAEDVSTDVISAYWLLLRARRDLEIQQDLLDQTLETLNRVEGRRGIDATAVQIKQTEASVKAREAFLIQATKRVSDAQDVLLSLMADPHVNVLTDTEIIPASVPHTTARDFGMDEILGLAMQNNAQIQQARAAIEIADINIEVANNARMPRLDLVTSARTDGIGKTYHEAREVLEESDYVSYAAGLVLEYPLGNRQRLAERHLRRLERRKAIASLHDVSDRLAIQAKEKVRKVRAQLREIAVQGQAMDAARIHLETLDEVEEIREKLTPEFLLVKFQAQGALAEARRAEAQAIAEFNIALAELAQVTGTVLQTHRVEGALLGITHGKALP